MKKTKAIIFDRDGTLIEYIPYLHKPKDVKLVNGVKEVLRLLKMRGFKLFLHTNQSGISRGLYSLEDVVSCNNQMLKLLNLGEDVFDKTCVAEDFPPSENTYRKPSPRFGNEILKDYNIDKSDLTYVGDNISDLETANNIGCNGLGVSYGIDDLKIKLNKRKDLDFIVLDSLLEVYKQITIE